MSTPQARSLEEQRLEFSKSRFPAMPIAGTIAWFTFPDQRFVVIPAVIVIIYLITICVLARCPRPWQPYGVV